MILVTGASGFIGTRLITKIPKEQLITLGRHQPIDRQNAMFFRHDISTSSDYSQTFLNVKTIIHLAARVHVMDDSSEFPLEEYREVNTYGTLHLARQAANMGVKRFIFISSIKVNGEQTRICQPFSALDQHAPQDCYAQSKSEAEIKLLDLAQETGMEVVIIRPPLIYGPGVKANFAALLNMASKGLPLPFANFDKNRRSLVSLDNLVDFILTCVEHPKAVNQVFLVSDNHDLSTAELMKMLSIACGKSSLMIPLPMIIFKLVAIFLGKRDVIERLTGSLQLDITKSMELLNWTPPQSVEQGFKQTADAFLESKNK